MKTVVIIGGGFAGLQVAKSLRKRMYVKPWGRWLRNLLSTLSFGLIRRREYERNFRIVLFSTENHTVFTPLLTEVIGASISPLHVVWSLRQMLPDVECLTAQVTRLHLQDNQISYRLPDGRDLRIGYNHLILACGSRVNMDLLPGMAAHGIPLKNLGDAVLLRNHLINKMEQAEVEPNQEIRNRLLSFVVIGGGFSGVEVAGEMLDLLRRCARYYPKFDPDDIQVYLLHSRKVLLPELPESLGHFAAEKLKERGLKILLETRASAITATDVRINGEEIIPAGTVVCTIGNAPLTIIESSDLPKRFGGWIDTEGTLRVKGYDNVWALGDCAVVPNAADRTERCPMTAQFAVRQAHQLADNLNRVFNGETESLSVFSYRNRGMFASIGHHTAVGQISMFVDVKLSGMVAWFLWRGFYLSKMPTLARKVQIALDWAWNMFFPPGIVPLDIEPTSRIPREHYEPGQFLFHKGDPADALYVVEKGTAGVYLDENERPVALLKSGEHFGERGLMGAGVRSASVKAEEPLDVLRIDQGSFNELLGHVDFFRAQMEGVIRRIESMGHLDGGLRSDRALNEVHVGDVMIERLATVPETALISEVREQASRENLGAVVVVDEHENLIGICTQTDLYNAALSRSDSHPVTEIMSRNLLTVRRSDPLVTAMYLFMKEPIKRLVVCEDSEPDRPIGWVTPFEIIPYMAESVNGTPTNPETKTKPLPKSA